MKEDILFLIGLTTLSLGIMIPFPNVSAEGEGTYPPPINDDWIIANETFVNDETIILNGNLSVQNGGFLTLNNVTLLMNSSFDGEFTINISRNGKFIVKDCNISANDPDRGYNFTIYGNMTIDRSEISYVLGEPLKDYNNNPGGIVIYSNDVRISNSTISYNRDRGISIIKSCPIIDNNRIFDNNYDAVFLYHSDAVITNNIFSHYSRDGGYDGLILCNFSNATISNNILINLTIRLDQSSPIITNNTIMQVTKSRDAINIWDFSRPVITNNLIKDSKYGIGIINGNQLLIANNTIINISSSGIFSSTSRPTDIGSEVIIMNNTILNCSRGVDIYEGSATIVGNNISDGGSGIVLGTEVSNILISENTISDNSKYGIWCMRGGPIIISENTITSNNWSGIHFNEEVNITIVNNKIINNSGEGIGICGMYLPDISYTTLISNNSISDSKIGISVKNNYSQEIKSDLDNLITDCDYGIYIIEESSPVFANFTISNTIYGIWMGSGPWVEGDNYPKLMNIAISSSSYGIWIANRSHPTIINATMSDIDYGVYIINSQLTIENSIINSTEFDFYLNAISVVFASNIYFNDNKIYLESNNDKIILPDRVIQGPYPRSSIESSEKVSWVYGYIFISIIIVILIIYSSTELGKYKLLLLLQPLYPNHYKNEILDQSTRRKVHHYIIVHPGSHYNIIKRNLKLKSSTLVYHLNILEREGLIKSERDGIYKRFYLVEMNKTEI